MSDVGADPVARLRELIQERRSWIERLDRRGSSGSPAT